MDFFDDGRAGDLMDEGSGVVFEGGGWRMGGWGRGRGRGCSGGAVRDVGLTDKMKGGGKGGLIPDAGLI